MLGLKKFMSRRHPTAEPSTELEEAAIESVVETAEPVVDLAGPANELLDVDWYARKNPDLANFDGPLIDHYLRHGRFEGRAPGPKFNPRWYSDLYHKEMGALDAFTHYATVGRFKDYRPVPLFADGRRIVADRRGTELLCADATQLPSCAVLIRTYEDDAFRLYYTLSSIARFCSGFDHVVVVCQEKAVAAIQPVVDAFIFASLQTCPPYSNDYVGQQVTKLLSYQFISEDIVIHVDSDCVFTEKVDFMHYMRDNKPILFSRTYNEIYRNFLMAPWQEPTSRFLLRQVDHEFMCGFPILHPRQLYIDLHDWFRKNHNFDYESIEYHLTSPTAFSEFNMLGAFSYYSSGGYHHHDNSGGAGFDFKSRQFCRGMNRADRRMSVEEVNEIEQIIGG